MIRVKAPNGVIYSRSELIPCPHGFSTRVGGVSTAPHTQSLNLGLDRGDGSDTVLENLRRFAEAVGFDPKRTVSARQIHSARVVSLTEEQAGAGWFSPAVADCDGLVSNTPLAVPAVRTADCVPVLLYAPPCGDSFGGAVAAAHAGWRGTAGGIVREVVRQLVALGAEVSMIRAAIGPSIGPCCYEVRADFYEAFSREAGVKMTERYVRPIPAREGVFLADLRRVNRDWLTGLGIPAEQIDLSEDCTACHPELFFSHRYSGGVRGSLLSAIALTESHSETR